MILDLLTSRYLDSVKNMKSDFVFGFIQSMDGEKDPRNLVLCFELVVRVVENFPDFVRFDEDLFEVDDSSIFNLELTQHNR